MKTITIKNINEKSLRYGRIDNKDKAIKFEEKHLDMTSIKNKSTNGDQAKIIIYEKGTGDEMTREWLNVVDGVTKVESRVEKTEGEASKIETR